MSVVISDTATARSCSSRRRTQFLTWTGKVRVLMQRVGSVSVTDSPYRSANRCWLTASRSMTSHKACTTASKSVLPDANPLVLTSSNTPSRGGFKTRSRAAHIGLPVSISRPSIQEIGSSGRNDVPGGRSQWRGSITSSAPAPPCSRCIRESSEQANAETCSPSAVGRSIASIKALTRAATASNPLPRWVVRSCARGVTAPNTGRARGSSGVRFATLVMGTRRHRGAIRAAVSATPVTLEVCTPTFVRGPSGHPGNRGDWPLERSSPTRERERVPS